MAFNIFGSNENWTSGFLAGQATAANSAPPPLSLEKFEKNVVADLSKHGQVNSADIVYDADNKHATLDVQFKSAAWKWAIDIDLYLAYESKNVVMICWTNYYFYFANGVWPDKAYRIANDFNYRWPAHKCVLEDGKIAFLNQCGTNYIRGELKDFDAGTLAEQIDRYAETASELLEVYWFTPSEEPKETIYSPRQLLDGEIPLGDDMGVFIIHNMQDSKYYIKGVNAILTDAKRCFQSGDGVFNLCGAYCRGVPFTIEFKLLPSNSTLEEFETYCLGLYNENK